MIKISNNINKSMDSENVLLNTKIGKIKIECKIIKSKKKELRVSRYTSESYKKIYLSKYMQIE